MKWSLFIFKTKLKDKIFLYNTLNDALIFLDENVYNYIDIYINNNSSSLNEYKNIINTLVEMEFIITEDINEKEKFLSNLHYEWINDKFMSLHILPTTECNFACRYCYQTGINRTYKLNSTDIKNVINYIKEYLGKHPIEKSTIIIHGGEPTLNWEAVTELMPQIKKLYVQYKVDFNTQIVTNGYLLTKEKSDFLYDFNWNRAQITLDGREEIHNKRRFLKNGYGTFKQILNNMQYIIENNLLHHIDLRINYDKENFETIPLLLEFLHEIFPAEKIHLSFGLVTPTIAKTNTYHFIPIEETPEYYPKLYKLAKKHGFIMPEFFIFDSFCTAKIKNSMIISADCKIYKCLSMVGRENFIVDDLCNDKHKIEEISSYFFMDLYELCFEKKCEFIPLCNTGCRFDAYLKNGTIKSIDCKREIIKKINNQLFEILYLGEQK